MAKVNITVALAPWAVVYVRLMARVGFPGDRFNSAVSSFVCQHGGLLRR